MDVGPTQFSQIGPKENISPCPMLKSPIFVSRTHCWIYWISSPDCGIDMYWLYWQLLLDAKGFHKKQVTKQTEIDKMMVESLATWRCLKLAPVRCSLCFAFVLYHILIHSWPDTTIGDCSLSHPLLTKWNLEMKWICMNLQFLIIFVKHEVSMTSTLNQNLPAVLHQDGSQNEWGWSKAKLGANAILVPWLP